MNLQFFAPASLLFALLAAGCASFGTGQGPVSGPAGTATAERPAGASENIAQSPWSQATAAILAAELAGRRGDVTSAAEYTLEAAQLARSVDLARRATQLAYSAEAMTVARESAQLWVELDPTDSEASALELRARVALGEARVKDLEDWLDAAEGVEGAEQQVVGLLAVASPDAQKALDLLLELERRRASAGLAYSTAALALRYERTDEAMAAIERAAARGWDADALDDLRLRVHLALKDYAAAAPVAKRLRTAQKEDRAKALAAGQLMLDAEAWDLAREQFAFTARMWPKDPAAQMALGLLAAQQGDRAMAREHFEKLWESGVRRDEAAWQLGRLAAVRGDWAKAEEWFGQVRDGQRAFDAKLAVAESVAQQGRVVEARSRLQELRKTSPVKAARVWRAEADVLRNIGQADEALKVLQQGIAETGADDLYYMRALVHESAGRLDAAASDLQQILDRDADNAQALNALGYMLADHGRDLDRARVLIERALELRPEDPAIRDSLGWVMYRQGKVAEAREQLAAAYRSFPDPEVAAHLVEVMWAMGDSQSARELLQTALERAPEHPRLLVLKNKLDRP